MIARFLAITVSVFIALLSAQSLSRHWSTADLIALSQQIEAGRNEPTDLERLRPLVGFTLNDPLACESRTALGTIMMYRASLIAQVTGRDALRDMVDPYLVAAKIFARETLRNALHCAPLDGTVWLDLALLEFGLRAPDRIVKAALTRARDLAPQEPGVHALRQRYFPDKDPKNTPGPF